MIYDNEYLFLIYKKAAEMHFLVSQQCVAFIDNINN